MWQGENISTLRINETPVLRNTVSMEGGEEIKENEKICKKRGNAIRGTFNYAVE